MAEKLGAAQHIPCASGALAEDILAMQEVIDFVASSWWRRWIIRLVSGGKVRFQKHA